MLHIPCFHQIADYVSTHESKVIRNLNTQLISIHDSSLAFYILNVVPYFQYTSYERCGVLKGEYVLYNGQILLGSNGIVAKATLSSEDYWGGHKTTDDFCNNENFRLMRNTLHKKWAEITLIESPILYESPYHDNYFHSSLELATRCRFFTEFKNNPILVTQNLYNKPFNQELMGKLLADREIIQSNAPLIRVKDPILSHEMMSESGVHWLRSQLKPASFPKGKQRIYLRRFATNAQHRVRKGGGIVETPEFIELLQRFGFCVLDLDERPYTIAEQMTQLNQAEIILAPHGAALTNIAYLDRPVSVIEIISGKTPLAMFLHLCSILGFRYYGIYSNEVDETDNIKVNVEELHGILTHCIAAAK